MNATIALTLGLGLLLASAAFAGDSELRAVKAQQVYVPEGFDDNDEVEVVLDGYLPSTCYKLAQHDVKIDDTTKTVTITQFARFAATGLCIDIIVPYTNVIHVGILPFGDYQIKTNSGALARPLLVKEATNSGPDDFLYAPIEAASVTYDEPTRSYVAEFAGRFTNTCMKLDAVRVVSSGLTLEVLPTVTLNQEEGCETADIPFRFTRPLPSLQKGRYLLHVRSMNGRSVNRIFPVIDPGDPIP